MVEEFEKVFEKINLLDKMIVEVMDRYDYALNQQRYDICDSIIDIAEAFVAVRMPKVYEKWLTQKFKIGDKEYIVAEMRSLPNLREYYRNIARAFLIQCLDALKRRRKKIELELWHQFLNFLSQA